MTKLGRHFASSRTKISLSFNSILIRNSLKSLHTVCQPCSHGSFWLDWILAPTQGFSPSASLSGGLGRACSLRQPPGLLSPPPTQVLPECWACCDCFIHAQTGSLSSQLLRARTVCPSTCQDCDRTPDTYAEREMRLSSWWIYIQKNKAVMWCLYDTFPSAPVKFSRFSLKYIHKCCSFHGSINYDVIIL